jgi:hypothetical protein
MLPPQYRRAHVWAIAKDTMIVGLRNRWNRYPRQLPAANILRDQAQKPFPKYLQFVAGSAVKHESRLSFGPDPRTPLRKARSNGRARVRIEGRGVAIALDRPYARIVRAAD